jgi:SAM-dependent methyltransferase
MLRRSANCWPQPVSTMSTIKKIGRKFLEFRRADRKVEWIWDQWRWRYFTFRHKKQAQLNLAFDRERGIETAAEMPLETVGVPQADVERGNGVYRPLTEALFRSAIAAIRIDVTKFTFVDIGSGKGKVLFMAADLPFKRIVGIEYASGLHEVAVRNVAAYRSPIQKCKEIVPIHADALEYKLPDGPLVLFIFNALDKPTMRSLLKKLDLDAASEQDRAIFLFYTNVRTVAEIGNVFTGLQNLRIVRRMRNFVILANEAGGTLVA